MPRVTVLVPNYNGARYLRQCLTSIQRQTYDAWHAVVGDNASEDDSVAIVRSLSDPRFRLVQRPRTISAMANFNLLLAEIDTEFVVILTSDDWWEPDFLKQMVGLLDAHPQSLLAASAVRVVAADTPVEVLGLHQLWPPERGTSCPGAQTLRFLVSKRNRLYLPAVLARRELFERLPPFDEHLVSDWMLFVRAAAVTPVEVCPQPLVNYRRHGESNTARAGRASIWGLDLLMALKLLQAEWASSPPAFADAPVALARSFTLKLIVEAYWKSLAGERQGALFYLRLARASAPTALMRACAFWCEKVIWLWTSDPVFWLGRPALDALRPLEAHFRRGW